MNNPYYPATMTEIPSGDDVIVRLLLKAKECEYIEEEEDDCSDNSVSSFKVLKLSPF